MRASRMKIKGLTKAQKNYLIHYLLDRKLIRRLSPRDFYISTLVKKVYENFKAAGVKKKPDHTPVLKYILLQDDNSFAIELPIWKLNVLDWSKNITGHVDLIGIKKSEKYEIRIMDYKPEGESNFVYSLPQVSLYALMLMDKLKPAEDNCEFRCYIFDYKMAWQFEPEILYEIDDKLEKWNIQRDWMPLLDHFSMYNHHRDSL